ncbi:MAG: hypothetical protein ABJC04_14030 [Verrucomicrobiota bacterium]
MEETQPPLVPENSAAQTSLFSRLTNVFVAPTEVFDEIKSSQPKAVNWIVPLALAVIAGVIYTLVVFSQPAVIQRMRDAQEKKFQEMVDTGKMTQAQADKTIETVQKYMGPGFLKITGSLGSIATNAAILFLVALVFWGVGVRALHAHFGYMQAVESVATATMINVLGTIVALLLAVIYGNMSMTPGPVLLVSHFDPANKYHIMLSALSITAIWYVGVLSIGLARLSGASFAKAAVWLYTIWAVLTFVPIYFLGGK